jgi:hypothetical protein
MLYTLVKIQATPYLRFHAVGGVSALRNRDRENLMLTIMWEDKDSTN